jgi:sugar O-acyltransferase (sialic acid O-acetyltransferase NeuD family)
VPETVTLGVPWLGDDTQVLAAPRGERWFALGVGGTGVSKVREQIAGRYDEAGVRWATVVHASAVVSPTAVLGEGAMVFAGAILNTGAVLGRHVVVNTGAVVEHDVKLGDFVQVGPAAALGGGVVVGRASYLGLGCRIRDHVAVGEAALVGMGAVVVAPVRAHAVVKGVPAKE